MPGNIFTQQRELFVETVLVFALYLCVVRVLACYVSDYVKYDCVRATVHSKTYFGMEKDACTRPMNGVCLGLVFAYRSRDYTGYTQSEHDKQKIGDKVDICVEKSDPAMFTTEKKRDAATVFCWLFLAVLLGTLASAKLSRLSDRSALVDTMTGAVFVLGLLFFAVVLMMKMKQK